MGGREHPQAASGSRTSCSRPCSGTPRNTRRVRPPSGLPEETHLHLSVSTRSSFVFTSQTTREGAGSHKRPWFGTLQESLAGKYGIKQRDRVPWTTTFRPHHHRETGRIRGRGAGPQASSFSRSPTCSRHIYTLRSRTPLSPPESPQPCGGSQKSPQCGQRAALGWRHAQYRQGPSGRSEPAQEEGSSWCQQERLGTRGPCVTTQRAPQGRRKGCTYRLRTFDMGTDGRHQRQQTGGWFGRGLRDL